MKSQPHIVFVASEAAPLAKTGGLADVAGALPHALMRLGCVVTVIMPYYRTQIDADAWDIQPMEQQITVWMDGLLRQASLYQLEVNGLRFILVEQDDLYGRSGIYGTPTDAYADNLLRYMFLCRVALEAASRLSQAVDIFHCHDWQTGMLPMLLKHQYQHKPSIAHAASVYTIHNLAYQGVFDAAWLSPLGIPMADFHPEGFEFYAQINCMKAGIMAADRITTVSQTYAEEILTPAYGCALEGFLAKYAHKLSGIVNGLDTDTWNPATDKAIAAVFSASNKRGKHRCKRHLQQRFGFQTEEGKPLLSVISRLADQKGVDLLIAGIPEWMDAGYQLSILGSGEPSYEQALRKLAAQYPDQMNFYCGFDEILARQIYAAADIFLMPSRFEPCGLGQLMAMRYGTIPVVRATGGLKDTVVDYTVSKSKATGFHFDAPDSESFSEAVHRAVAIYHKPRIWQGIVSRAMRRDSSWNASAHAYLELYNDMIDATSIVLGEQ